MKKIGLLLLLTAGLAFGQTKKVVKSDVQWKGFNVAKTSVSSHNGIVKVKSGSVQLKNNQLVGGTFVLDMKSINATDITGDRQKRLNNHLKNGDFFEVEKFPTAKFVITSVAHTNGNHYNVTGTLTVKNNSGKVTFPATITYANGVLNFASQKFTFDRKKYGVQYDSFMKDVLIKDDVEMQVSFTAK
ncbi:YceI family protein [Elizabethkingia sp. JS20170427COW]|uniref:YceI family protein n=1 Tax=Elizabethkingia sp. JS20170427COW TaxID=2583851 RepID=UPI0011105118|nr:YceI family protein [Elizabethkingia sp. JS20170427COW]QCX53809.1 YceI family protein [Elizabethkingia sp. JS20170427COW]